ncbi:hypothetical protein PIB30_078662 [Stylosanthes scabra]|uniref:Uncharacterized protein n=1 Tax=Stylosanthes scabra TaxID=79078 RepID=A0ABU6VSU9_9FABA|nr:hypothetical protein [Stylosanthes scabra]
MGQFVSLPRRRCESTFWPSLAAIASAANTECTVTMEVAPVSSFPSWSLITATTASHSGLPMNVASTLYLVHPIEGTCHVTSLFLNILPVHVWLGYSIFACCYCCCCVFFLQYVCPENNYSGVWSYVVKNSMILCFPNFLQHVSYFTQIKFPLFPHLLFHVLCCVENPIS